MPQRRRWVKESNTSRSMVIHSPLLVFLMCGEESNEKLAPAPCANADEIILFWVVLGVG